MSTSRSRAARLASSEDGRHIVWSDSERLVVFDVLDRVRVAELELGLDAPVELAIAGAEPQRLAVVQASGGNTVMRVFTMPDLRPIVETKLRGESRVGTVCGDSVVLLAGDGATVVDLAELRTAILPVRGPIQLVAATSPGQFLVGSRGKLEAWSLEERRPTHKVGLPLPSDATFAGTLSQARLFWFASTRAPGTVTLHRLADGMHLSTVAAGGAIKAILGDPASTTVVAAVEPEPGSAVELVALDLKEENRRVLALDAAPSSFCLAGSPADAVAICSEALEPVLVPLSTNEAPQSFSSFADRRTVAPGPRATTVAESVDEGASAAAKPVTNGARQQGSSSHAYSALAAKLDQWRSQLHETMSSAPRRARDRGARTGPEEPRSRSRAELYAWGQAARNRSTPTPPPPPQGFRLNELVARFRLDTRSKTLLALLYASWLDGEGRAGLPVALIARALGNDEESWIEALAQGHLGKMGWIRSRYGRTRLHPVVGSFLDEAPARVPVVPPDEETASPVAPPAGPAVLQLADGVALDEHARELAVWLGGPVATIDLAMLPANRVPRALAERVLEARLHGALPIVVLGTDTSFELSTIDSPALIAIQGLIPAAWQALPVWPPPPAAPVAEQASPEPDDAGAAT